MFLHVTDSLTTVHPRHLSRACTFGPCLHVLFLAHIATAFACIHLISVSILHQFILIFQVFTYLEVGIQVEVYVTCMTAAACPSVHCVLSVLRAQIDSSNWDGK